nr:ARMT1-like domain-containing protein [Candidatus Sigynarchaeota archaeon]
MAHFIKPYCSVCLLDMALSYFQASTSDHATITAGMKKIINMMKQDLNGDAYTFLIGNKIAREVCALLGKEDLFEAVKRRSNEVCESMFPSLLDRYKSITDFDEKMDFVLCAIVAGNVIDVSTPGHDFKLESAELFKIIEEIHDRGFAINDRKKLKTLVLDPRVKKFLLVLDNAGEIVFDKLLVMFLKEHGKNVTCMVKGKPISNDATKADLRDTGMDKLCDGILETSIASVGYVIPDNEKNVVDTVNGMDVVIGKGQANLETLCVYLDEIKAKHVFIVSRIKCPTVAEFQGVKKGQQIVRQIK